jgi:hypothetical protein
LSCLRAHPKEQSGRHLREIVKHLSNIKTKKDKNSFIKKYAAWINLYKENILLEQNNSIAFKDFKKAISLIKNALKDMFHFIDDSKIPSTTNAIENFFKHLKREYRNHNGLSQKHKIAFLKWYYYFKNNKK